MAELSSSYDEIRKNLNTDKLIIGTEKTLKLLRQGKLSKVFLSKNAASDTVADVEHYATLSKVEVVHLDVPNDDLGGICKKPFNISVLGLM